MGSTSLRRAVGEDVARLLEIQACCPEAAQWAEPNYWATLIRGSTLQCLVAETEGQVVGMMVYQRLRVRETEILNLAVDPAHRRRGVGRKLVESLLEQSPGDVILEVREGNQAARTFYDELGFVDRGRRRNYYRDPEEDAVVMRRRAEAECG